eukprot:2730470-Pleurochrysis_carterae.AAC.1
MTGLKTQTWRDPVAVGYDCAPQQTGDYSLALGCRACFGGSQSFDCVAIGSECKLLVNRSGLFVLVSRHALCCKNKKIGRSPSGTRAMRMGRVVFV